MASLKATAGIALMSVTASAFMAGCGAPGADNTAPTSARSISTEVGSDPVTLKITAGDEAPGVKELGALFSKKYPIVTVEVTQSDFQTLTTSFLRIAGADDAPDLLRTGNLSSLVKNKLITNLDPYAEAYGWDKWPSSQFDTVRVSEDGSARGNGPIYGTGPGFGFTGVFYNKEIAARIGMTTPPATLEDFEAAMAKAKAEGIQPMIVAGKDPITAFPLQGLAIDYAGKTADFQNWALNKQGASIDTDAMVKAAATLQKWGKEGYLPADVNALDMTTASGQFTSGAGLFMAQGTWAAPPIDKAGAGKFGFFAFPASKDGGVVSAAAAPSLFVIPTKAKNADVAAAFLNFVHTDAEARQVTYDVIGNVPAGPADGSTVKTKDGTTMSDALNEFKKVSEGGGLTEFLANATPGFANSTLTPQIQLLLAGKATPEGVAAKFQSDYLAQLNRK
ncbi:extracellular solute-binding protein [Arthrobacter sp. BE255]|uniref:ABC transporter substrate-binding protein n=1 Tax=Arthrobacter sp. BE255 TaxID=2817721 RepID=UPI002864717E|nr:extracellular solute-binding protein [Arthrobacter sp. BE255]MDR7159162.1 maltose-binding protein MalE [Arthrobacter sp. BE255]